MGKQKISAHAISMLEYLHQKQKLPVSKILKQNLKCLSGLSQSTIYKHATGKFGNKISTESDRSVGRPAKIQSADMRNIRRAISSLRNRIGYKFTVAAVQLEAHLTHLHSSTVRKAMYKLGFKNLVARKKGVLSVNDKKLRLQWARRYRNKSKQDWAREICLWTDIVGFEFKVISCFLSFFSFSYNSSVCINDVTRVLICMYGHKDSLHFLFLLILKHIAK